MPAPLRLPRSPTALAPTAAPTQPDGRVGAGQGANVQGANVQGSPSRLQGSGTAILSVGAVILSGGVIFTNVNHRLQMYIVNEISRVFASKVNQPLSKTAATLYI